MFLGLVGAPTTKLSYEAFKAARAVAGATGALYEGAAAAAIGSIAAQGALVLGAGAFGWMIGQKILESLEAPTTDYPTAIKYRVPDGAGQIRVIATSKVINQPEQTFDNVWPAPMIAPVVRQVGGGVIAAGVLVGTPLRFEQYVGGGADLFENLLTIQSVTKVNGDPVQGLRKVPGLPTISPVAPFRAPTTIPVPGRDPYPITPTVVPNPSNDPDLDDDKTKAPGLVVQVPEVGMQFNFALDGVAITRYRSPETEPNEIPKIPTPPNFPSAKEDPCPCPPEEDKSAEIICRVKTLQDEILDDGFTVSTIAVVAAQSSVTSLIPSEFFRLEVTATQFPVNVKRIRYASPALDAVFLGYVAFVLNGIAGEQLPIRFTQQQFIPPQGCTGFIIAGNEGCQIGAIAYSRVKKDFIDVC